MIAQNVANCNQKRDYFNVLEAWYSHPIRHTLTAGEREVMNAILHVANVYRFAPVLEIPKAALCHIACVCKDTLRNALETFQNLHLIYIEPSPKHHNNRICICIDYPLIEKGEVGASESTLGTHKTECEASETKCEHHDNDCENQGCGQTRKASLEECGQAKNSSVEKNYPQENSPPGESPKNVGNQAVSGVPKEEQKPKSRISRWVGQLIGQKSIGTNIESEEVGKKKNFVEYPRKYPKSDRVFQEGDTCPRCNRFQLRMKFKTNLDHTPRRDAFLACSGYKRGCEGFTTHVASKPFTSRRE